MKKIFLCSYFAGVGEQFKAFIQTSNIKTNKVLFIPTAGNVEEYTGYIDEGRQVLTSLHYKVDELNIDKEDTEYVANKISAANMIYISGGNTFYLLQELKRKNLLPLLINEINSGVPYIGESAGAIILAPSIEYNKIMDDTQIAPDLKDYTGLNITDFYTLPHFIEPPFTDSVQETFKTYKDQLNLLAINNSQAIIVNEDNYKVI
ncbi:Type 1 glutamine amidotransferase-like domain-containing protein [Lactobacillus sp. ESL0677]|uniref:Type 1 glutamine amidotransferase-like domain-containing protein n=1 Tax=Lactobacillus sp. ESL0677 TaxID=2983208 RepID=UPI0023F7EF60|nr:Type 1 glutamine amidotransferase-like domain-containing protein [Lactobacillus sp. ESL0677]WEV37296.1 Type 1 glutamine amidotransferase-like domain-containing protein [Lactobacillus sp. ESL0677]